MFGVSVGLGGLSSGGCGSVGIAGGGLQQSHFRPIKQHFPVPHVSCACNIYPGGHLVGIQTGAVPTKVHPSIGGPPREVKFEPALGIQ